MKALLLFKDRDWRIDEPSTPWNAPALAQDLGLPSLLEAMAGGDEFLYKVAEKIVLSNLLSDADAIVYRQQVLRDSIKNADIVRDIYAVAGEGVEAERKGYRFLSTYMLGHPGSLLTRSVEILKLDVAVLKKLRSAADEHAAKFDSQGFRRFFAMLDQELSDDYFAVVERQLQALGFREGILISAQLGEGNKGLNYLLHRPPKKQKWLERIFAEKPASYSFSIHPRDVNGANALGELKDRGLNLVTGAVTRAAEHILGFFTMLRNELAFYIGCLNLRERLAEKGMEVCFPEPLADGARGHTFQGLYDAALALTTENRVVGNEVNADGKDLVIITGANQGGKSTFLKSVGLAQLMMQCGMFAPARSFRADVRAKLFTHYRRREDTTMTSGKLDEELNRMSEIVDSLSPNSLVLFNESFAATNEREGSEIARQITSALLEKDVTVFFVTHQYEFARGFYEKHLDNAVYLRAERKADGTRTFKLREGEPLQTSFGKDVYENIFDNHK